MSGAVHDCEKPACRNRVDGLALAKRTEEWPADNSMPGRKLQDPYALMIERQHILPMSAATGADPPFAKPEARGRAALNPTHRPRRDLQRPRLTLECEIERVKARAIANEVAAEVQESPDGAAFLASVKARRDP